MTALPPYGTLKARREAREAVAHPGKFEGESPMTPLLYWLTLDGGGDDLWTREWSGDWCERAGRWLVCGSDTGSVYAEKFATADEAYARAEAAYAVEDEQDEDEADEVPTSCDQCAWARINGVFCHETGCPNARKR